MKAQMRSRYCTFKSESNRPRAASHGSAACLDLLNHRGTEDKLGKRLVLVAGSRTETIRRAPLCSAPPVPLCPGICVPLWFQI